MRVRYAFFESGCLGMQLKAGGKFHLKLNMCARPIANKYREGKMKRTLKRELKVPETAERESDRCQCLMPLHISVIAFCVLGAW
jgi:hypothetical protein